MKPCCTTAGCAASLLLLALVPGAVEAQAQPPKPSAVAPHTLTAEELANLIAFTRAFGLIRFFHPSDEAALAGWDQLATTGVEAVEGAHSSRDLAARLGRVFANVAPTAQFLAEGDAVTPLHAPRKAAYVVRWRHQGFGIGQRPELAGIYRSERERRPAPPRPADWASPTDPLRGDLGRGVTLALPTVVWADADGRTIPTPEVRPGKTAQHGGSGAPGQPAGRSTRLAAVAVGWTAVQHFFPYFEEIGTNWDEQLATALSRAADGTGTDFLVTLKRMMAALHDGHADAYRDDEEPVARPPVQLSMVEGQPVVASSWGEAEATLPPGSVLLAVEGQPVASRIAELAAQISASTRGWLDTLVALQLLTGAPGSRVSLDARLPSGERAHVVLTRARARADAATSHSAATREVREGVWYVNLSKVTTADLEPLYATLAAARAVIFDLRSYPRVDPSFVQHLIEKPVAGPRLEVPIITGPTHREWAWTELERWTLAALPPRIKGRVAFLTGGGTISYGETLLDIAATYRLGVIVGTASAGTNGTVVELRLPGDYVISWTGMRVRRSDGQQLFGVGFPATVTAAPTVAGLAAKRDEVLDAAIGEVTR